MVGCPEHQRPPSRSSQEAPSQFPPKLNLNAQKGVLPRSSKGAGGAVRSLSPALHVLQRSILTPGPDTPRLPDAPRGERPREYLAALSGAATSGRCERLPSPVPPLSPRCSPNTEASSGGARAVTTPNTSRPSRPSTPLHFGDARHKAPHSARMRRSSSEHVTDALPQVQSARSSRARPLSAAAQLWTLDEKIDMGEVWRTQMWPTERRFGVGDGSTEGTALYSTAPRRESKKPRATSVPRPQSAVSEDPMDALDGLLASLDEERATISAREMEKSMVENSPRTKSMLEKCMSDNPLSKKSRPDARAMGDQSLQEAKSTPGAKHKYGSTPVHKRPSTVDKSWPSVIYDDEVDASSPLPALAFDESQASAIHCPVTPSILSVHMPGSPIPQVAQAVEFDDTAASLVILGELQKPERQSARPCKVRVECPDRGNGIDSNKHTPQAPGRRFNGTGKISSRPLGCVHLANFGGA